MSRKTRYIHTRINLIDNALKRAEKEFLGEEALKKSIRIIEADVAELIRHETERLFSPDQIWWEKKLYLPAEDETADLNFATFMAYLAKKFKAPSQELKEWSVLTARYTN